MSFSGNLNIKQTGHAIVHLDKYNEHYLIPMPNCKIRGFLSANLYPELYGTYYISLRLQGLSSKSHSPVKGTFLVHEIASKPNYTKPMTRRKSHYTRRVVSGTTSLSSQTQEASQILSYVYQARLQLPNFR